MTRRSEVAGAILIAAVAACSAPVSAQAPPSARLAATIDFFGARIGMSRAELLTRTPATAIGGVRCAAPPSDDPRLLFLECGPHNLTVDFTAAGKVWQIRASYDLTDTPLRSGDARTALIARYGKPTGTDPVGGLTWLAPGTPAAQADPCAYGATLLSGAIARRGALGIAAPVPAIDPGCMPIRTAILADHGGHRAVIVEAQDARPRLAELARPPGEPTPGRR